jgi:hypothetical protein
MRHGETVFSLYTRQIHDAREAQHGEGSPSTYLPWERKHFRKKASDCWLTKDAGTKRQTASQET